jgi:hypothetical protein
MDCAYREIGSQYTHDGGVELRQTFPIIGARTYGKWAFSICVQSAPSLSQSHKTVAS